MPSTKPGYSMYTDGNSYVFVAPAAASIGTRNYETIQNAIAAVTDNTQTTIKMLKLNTYSTPCSLSNKNITFDLNGFGVIFNPTTVAIPLEITNCNIDYTGTGVFKVISSVGYATGLSAVGGSCKLTYVETAAVAGNFAVVAANSATVQVNGDVNAPSGDGIFSRASIVTVVGNVKAINTGVSASQGSKVTINGTMNATTTYINFSGTRLTKNDFTLPSDFAGYALYTDNGTNKVYVKGTAPTITGSTSMSEQVGYTAFSTSAFTTTGDPAPRVTKTTGNASITWNDATKKLDIAPGLTAGTYPVTLAAQNGITPDGTFTFTLTVTNAAAVENVEIQNLKIYPNPVKDQLRIKNDELRIENVEIVDLSGRAVLMGEFNSPLQNDNPVGAYCIRQNETTINVSALPQGIYFVKITTDKGIVTRKLIKE